MEEASGTRVEDLIKENAKLKMEVEKLKSKLGSLQKQQQKSMLLKRCGCSNSILLPIESCKLTKRDIERYSRQLLLDGLGPGCQKKILSTSVILIGAGGLASSASMYLSGAGIGRLGIVDFDNIEMSNLQRQPVHKECCIGTSKAESIIGFLSEFNSSIDLRFYNVKLSSANALEIIMPYDIVLDCTDNISSRYLINDACVLGKKCLISGSALRFEGHVTVFGYGNDGPCYRCLFPNPPPKEAQGSCNVEGVLGVVPGIIGMLQALECLKIAGGFGEILSGKMVYFNALESKFKLLKLRNRVPSCSVCGDNPTITELVNYEQFCQNTDDGGRLLPPELIVSVEQYEMARREPHLLLDVRPRNQYEICCLKPSLNVPLEDLKFHVEKIREMSAENLPIYVICRRGNDSRTAVFKLAEMGFKTLKNIDGGYYAWSKTVDTDFPVY